MPPHSLALGLVLLVIVVIIAMTSTGRSKAVPASVVMKNIRQ